MSEVVNLRRARKAKARMESAAQADANRVKHSVSKVAHDLAKASIDKAQRDLVGRKLDEK